MNTIKMLVAAVVFSMFGCVLQKPECAPDLPCPDGGICDIAGHCVDNGGPSCNNNGTCGVGENNDNCPGDCPLYDCGDGYCDPQYETATSCPEDCGSYCGDDVCNDNENRTNCWSDCHVCGDNVCDNDETTASCAQDCPAQGPVCGDGICAAGENCVVDCQVTSQCGNDICEATENHSSCAQDCPSVCGDHLCEIGEPSGCPIDCVGVCGNLSCEGTENHNNCPSDCPVPATCNNGSCEQGENVQSCPQDCQEPSSCGNGTCNKSTNLANNEDAGNCPIDCHPDPIISLGNACVGIANDYVFNSLSGYAYKIVGPASFPNEVLMNQVVTVGVFQYLKLCNLAQGTYEIWATDAQGGAWFWGDPEVFGNISDQGLCYVEHDDALFTGYHGKFVMQANGQAVGTGDVGPASCPDPVATNNCGDGVCSVTETNANCPADCPVVATCNNNNVCDSNETNANCSNDCYPVPVNAQNVSGQSRCVGYSLFTGYIPNNGAQKIREVYSPSFLNENISDLNGDSSRVEKCGLTDGQVYEETYKDSLGNYSMYGELLNRISADDKKVIYTDPQGHIKLRFGYINGVFKRCGNGGVQGAATVCQ